MIAHCPACGTHYRHDVLATPMRGRCGRCDTTIDLSRLRPYRLVGPRAIDTVTLATSIAPAEAPLEPAAVAVAIAVASHPEPARETLPALPASPMGPASWENEDPLPAIPEMASVAIDLRPTPAATDDTAAHGADASGAGAEAEAAAGAASEGRGTTWLLWVAAGAIAGTGTSWTMGGTTLAGVAIGASAGALLGWGWLRWMSPR